MIEVPRSLQEILDNAESLAQQFEDMPDDVEVLDAAPLRRIRQATQARAIAERELAAAVADARKRKLSWAVIGAYVGTSGEAVRQRYGGSTSGSAASVGKKVAKQVAKKTVAKKAASRRTRAGSPRVVQMPSPARAAAKKQPLRQVAGQAQPPKPGSS